MPSFPKTPASRHPCGPSPLAGVEAVLVRVEIAYPEWDGAFFPQLHISLAEAVQALLVLGGLRISKSPSSPALMFEAAIKTFHACKGIDGGFAVKVEAYLQENVRLERAECPLDVITWGHALNTWLVFRRMTFEEIAAGIRGEFERQTRAFLADWWSAHPHRSTFVPLPACPPTLQTGNVVHSAATTCEDHSLAGLAGANIVHLEYCSGSRDFSNLNPGAIELPKLALFERLAQHGIRLFRFPLRWERLQPRLGRELSTVYLAHLQAMIEDVRKVGGKVILDLHNSLRYAFQAAEGEPITSWIVGRADALGHVPLPQQALISLWTQLSDLFAKENIVIAYGLMNQPYPPETRTSGCSWPESAAAIARVLRARGDHKLILVDGENYAYADDWPSWNPKPLLEDRRVVYEAHLEMGDVRPGARELLQPFLEWCRRHGVPGFLGSVRIDSSHPHYGDMAADFLRAAQESNLGWCYWPSADDLEMANPLCPVWQS